ncbi:MAG: hypothetical protein WCY07_05575 [Pigmentiphaga sp.]
MMTSLITFALFVLGFWSVFELDVLFRQLIDSYWIPLQLRLREEGGRLALLLVSALVSLYSAWLAIRQTLARAQSWECEAIPATAAWRVDPDYKRSGYRSSTAAPIANRFLYSPAVNRALVLASRIPFTLKKEKWSLKNPGTDLLPFAVAEATRRGALIFDETKIRLGSDLLLGPDGLSKPLTLQRTRYFYGLATNDVSFKKVQKRREAWDPDVSPYESEVYDGVSLFAQPGAASEDLFIKKLIDSACSNHIGVSTLAITSDGSLIITGQAASNAQSGNTWAPSGSGSADWQDLRHAKDLVSLVQRAAERELIEECGLPRSVAFKTLLLGFARNVHRGGKPEFFCLTLLSLRAAELRLKHKEGEKVFTAYNVYDALPQKIDFRLSCVVPSLESFRERFAAKMSGPMALALDMLRDAVAMPDSPIRSALAGLDLSHPWYEGADEEGEASDEPLS